MTPTQEPRRPKPGENNLWYEDRNTDSVIVFVHGVLSDSHGCWYRPSDNKGSAGTYWPDLLLRDKRFNRYSIYLGGYYTAIDAGPYDIAACAQELYTALNRRKEDRQCIFERKSIVFVCHSLGGVVVRYMLDTHSNSLADKHIGIVLIASPSYGSKLASQLNMIAEFYKNALGMQLEWGSWSLQDLDSRFKRLITEKRIPKLHGIEACENHFVVHRKWLPDRKIVVSKESAGRYFDDPILLRNTDHFSCVKPNHDRHPAYELLQDFCTGFERELPPAKEVKEPALASSASLAFPVKTTPRGAYTCRELHWDLEIDDEGDAHNEMSFQGIVLRDPKEDIELPRAETQAGHMSPYELVRHGHRTSEGVSLEAREIAPRAIRVSVHFENRPTEARPANFCLVNDDYNVYSMNMAEYRQKTNWRADGVDFLEKAIDEEFGVISVAVRFPKQIRLTGPPFFEVYNEVNSPDGPQEVRNDELTGAFQDCFYYSLLLNTAFLRIPLPPSPFLYRISWVLGESPIASTATLTPLLRKRQRDFSRFLLGLRTIDLGVYSSAAWPTAEPVFAVLASFTQFVTDLLDRTLKAKSGLSADQLDVSLMVLDDSVAPPVLKVAVGTKMADPSYRNFKLAVGDGNAGRAWKRKLVRIFDAQSTDAGLSPYMSIPGSPPHSILFSIPLIDPASESLIYGILNLGAFSKEAGELLRELTTRESIQEMIDESNTYVLTKLLEIVKVK